ncbi:hypothetical protein BH09BAC2_BH09BAC2_20230 [soil metagenome]
MHEKVHYDTVTDAINNLKQQGYTIDFNLEENCLTGGSGKYEAKDFTIVDVYRYEGASDPGDEAAVYALESEKGIKGILVAGYGISADTMTTSILSKLKVKGKN